MRIATLGAALVVLASCGSVETRSNLASGPGTIVDDALAAKVIGSYAIRSTLATIQKLPVFGPTPSLASTDSLLQITREGQGLIAKVQLCRIQLSSSSPVAQVIPPSYVQAVPAMQAPFRLWQDGDSLHFAKDPVALVLGAKLKDAETDALPTSAKDERVFDQDADGHPGVTVKVSSQFMKGEIYLVQRLKEKWEGRLDEAGLKTALLQDFGEQTVIEASSPVLKKPVAATPDPDPGKSQVRFVRLDSQYDCTRLVQEQDALFPTTH